MPRQMRMKEGLMGVALDRIDSEAQVLLKA